MLFTRVSEEDYDALVQKAADCGSPNVAEYVRELIARDLGKGRLPLDSYLLLRCMLAVDYKLTATLKSSGLSRETLDQIRYEAEEHSKNLTDPVLGENAEPRFSNGFVVAARDG